MPRFVRPDAHQSDSSEITSISTRSSGGDSEISDHSTTTTGLTLQGSVVRVEEKAWQQLGGKTRVCRGARTHKG